MSAIAWLTNDNPTKVWRLSLTEDGSRIRVREIPEFGGDIWSPSDFEKVNAIVGAWGYSFNGATWTDTNGGWLVPIVKTRG